MLLLEDVAKRRCPLLMSFLRSRLTSKTAVAAPDQVSAKARVPLEAVAKERTTKDNLKDSHLKEESLIALQQNS